MRIGYGYKRSDKDFDAWECERVYVDIPRTQREERADMFQMLRDGDTLFMFTKGELGHGVELKNFRQRLEDMGVAVEYPPAPVDGRGRPKKFDPSPEDDVYLRTLWKSGIHSKDYCLRKASERTGVDVKRHQMIYRYGNRS